MASTHPPRKKSVDLGARGVRVSRIRRDPPPRPERTISAQEIRDREAWTTAGGITLVALALLAILVGFATVSGRPLTTYKIVVQQKG